MIKCPSCGNPMCYREGTSSKGRHYEFYGCSTYPTCSQIVEVEDASKYEDGQKHEMPERTIEEEACDLRDILLKEGHSWEDADYARHMWEKD